MLRKAVLSIVVVLSAVALILVTNSEEEVSGSVFFEDGDSAPYAEINIYNQETDELIYSGVADEKGEFSLVAMKPGRYDVNLSYAGHQTVSKSVNLIKGRCMDLGKIALRALFANDLYTIKPGIDPLEGS